MPRFKWIRWPESLAVRVPLVMTCVQAAFIVVAMIGFPLLAPFTNYGTIADATLRRHLVASLKKTPDGVLRIAPTGELEQYVAARPGLSYAIITPQKAIVGGSDPGLSTMLLRIAPAVPRPDGNLETDQPGVKGGTVLITTDKTAFGVLTFATAGNLFKFEDAPSFIGFFLPAVLPAYGPVLLGAFIVLPLLLSMMLRPLRDVARAAGHIDLKTLDRRLPSSGLPSELRPVVAEINAALDRVADSWARQRLFTANAAHELRTPVAVLQARIDAMPPFAADRSALARDARRLRLLVDQLLAVARLDRRQAAMDGAVELVGCVRALVADCAPLALRSGRSIAFHPLAAAVTVRGDAQAIEGAVANLIDNALRAEPEGGTVDVVVHADDCAVIEVRDHGTGVDPADRTLVFEPFWRKDERTAGTGLGLAAVREVALLHGGAASVSDTPGGGATFQISLPFAPRNDLAAGGEGARHPTPYPGGDALGTGARTGRPPA